MNKQILFNVCIGVMLLASMGCYGMGLSSSVTSIANTVSVKDRLYAAVSSDDVHTLKTIFADPANGHLLNGQESDPSTPLITACFSGSINAAYYLLALGADPLYMDQDDSTALNWVNASADDQKDFRRRILTDEEKESLRAVLIKAEKQQFKKDKQEKLLTLAQERADRAYNELMADLEHEDSAKAKKDKKKSVAQHRAVSAKKITSTSITIPAIPQEDPAIIIARKEAQRKATRERLEAERTAQAEKERLKKLKKERRAAAKKGQKKTENKQQRISVEMPKIEREQHPAVVSAIQALRARAQAGMPMHVQDDEPALQEQLHEEQSAPQAQSSNAEVSIPSMLPPTRALTSRLRATAPEYIPVNEQIDTMSHSREISNTRSLQDDNKHRGLAHRSAKNNSRKNMMHSNSTTSSSSSSSSSYHLPTLFDHEGHVQRQVMAIQREAAYRNLERENARLQDAADQARKESERKAKQEHEARLEQQKKEFEAKLAVAREKIAQQERDLKEQADYFDRQTARSEEESSEMTVEEINRIVEVRDEQQALLEDANKLLQEAMREGLVLAQESDAEIQ